MSNVNPIFQLYSAFLLAEELWGHEMRKVTRERIGDFRYTRAAQGEPGTPLRAAYDDFVSAGDRWRAAAFDTDRKSA